MSQSDYSDEFEHVRHARETSDEDRSEAIRKAIKALLESAADPRTHSILAILAIESPDGENMRTHQVLIGSPVDAMNMLQILQENLEKNLNPDTLMELLKEGTHQ